MSTAESVTGDEVVEVYIGVGSNLADPVRQVSSALGALGELAHTRCIRVSSLYRNPPVGPVEQPDFVNAVAALATRLRPHSLLEALQSIEGFHGRRRTGMRWGPRTLDLDILVYGDIEIETELLTIPHPRIRDRAFVLHPLNEIAPELMIPGQGSVASLLAGLSTDDLERVVGERA